MPLPLGGCEVRQQSPLTLDAPWSPKVSPLRVLCLWTGSLIPRALVTNAEAQAAPRPI